MDENKNAGANAGQDIDKQIAEIDRAVRAALEEVTLAIMFHESWKPAAYDTQLHERARQSKASQTLHIIRISLRRELLLSLMRIWDSNKQALRAGKIVHSLRGDKYDKYFEALHSQRSDWAGNMPGSIQAGFSRRLQAARERIIDLGNKYQKGGAGYETLDKLKLLRNEQLAHRQLESLTSSADDITDDQIEAFYNDTIEMVQSLVFLVLGAASDLEGVIRLYKEHARRFWELAVPLEQHTVCSTGL